jgi:hypothetical protein
VLGAPAAVHLAWEADLAVSPAVARGAAHAHSMRLSGCLRGDPGSTVKGCKQRFLGRCQPPSVQGAAHNFYYVIMVQHAKCI